MGLRAFVVRPFGEREDRNGEKINFDKVDEQLIAPALERLGIEGGTTGDIVRAGNIREDMFNLLLTADLVVADVSIDNANVFYELGIRQALRDKWTVLLRCKADKFPFDLSTDRYQEYSRDNPAASLDNLVSALNETINGSVTDSPVFKLLPALKLQDHKNLVAVPEDFREEVDRAERSKLAGNLELLADEARGFPWEGEGLRLVGRSQFELKAMQGARRSWEGVRNFDPDDLEANQKLATIYQRLGWLSDSDVAVKRALNRKILSSYDRAEVRSLRASNEKSRWRDEWWDAPPEQRSSRALRSEYLNKALNEYVEAFEEDLNHYYAGINALAMCVIQARLAETLPEVWAERFDTEDEGLKELDALRKKIGRLTAIVQFSLQAARKRQPGIWIEMSDAALVLLTATRPSRVAMAYRKALTGAAPFVSDVERRQLQLYERLGILTENVARALDELSPASQTQELRKQRVLLFAGHMLDKPGRVPSRFPVEYEEIARQEIRKAVMAEQAEMGVIAYGIAGGANGGDLLFHEVCAELGIRTELWLALPSDQYLEAAVQPYVGKGTNKLVERFNQLRRQLSTLPLSMADTMDLPRWLRIKPGYNFWRRHTKWIIFTALNKIDLENLTLIALYDGEQNSGTYDYVQKFRERGGKIVQISTKEIFDL